MTRCAAVQILREKFVVVTFQRGPIGGCGLDSRWSQQSRDETEYGQQTGANRRNENSSWHLSPSPVATPRKGIERASGPFIKR